VSTSLLRQHGLLKPNQHLSGTMTWGRNGNITERIAITVNTYPANPYLELDYIYLGKPILSRVALVSAPSNLGKGVVWFFICPRTGKRCRKLYLYGANFLHRSALSGCLYKKQTLCKKMRHIENTFGVYMRADTLSEQLDKKHFKTQYAGKPTKKYVKLTQQIQRAKSIPLDEINAAILQLKP